MLNRTKIVLVTLVIAMLATTWGMVGTAVAQKAAVPKPQDKLAIGEDEAKQLLLLAQQFGTREGDGLRVAHDMTQLEIAQLVGASREATNQALGTFADHGWIQSESHNVLILDAEKLARRAR